MMNLLRSVHVLSFKIVSEVASLGASVDHSTECDDVWHNPLADHASEPNFCAIGVSTLGTSIDDGCVSGHARLQALRLHFLQPSFGTLNRTFDTACVDERVEAHCIWLHTSVDHLLEPRLSGRYISTPGARINCGGIADDIGFNALLQHVIEPLLACLWFASLRASVEQCIEAADCCLHKF